MRILLGIRPNHQTPHQKPLSRENLAWDPPPPHTIKTEIFHIFFAPHARGTTMSRAKQTATDNKPPANSPSRKFKSLATGEVELSEKKSQADIEQEDTEGSRSGFADEPTLVHDKELALNWLALKRSWNIIAHGFRTPRECPKL